MFTYFEETNNTFKKVNDWKILELYTIINK